MPNEATMSSIHAHKCEVCALNGIETLWIHGDCQKGDEAAHACPRCGSKEWRPTPVLVGKLPTEQKRQKEAGQVVNVFSPNMTLLLICLSLLMYIACLYTFQMISKKK